MTTLRERIRQQKFDQRVELASVVANCSSEEERIQIASEMIQEIKMHRVFDRFSNKQMEYLLDILEPLAELSNVEPGAQRKLFGDGCYSKLPKSDTDK